MSHADPIKVENVNINKLELRFPKKESKNPNGSVCYVYHDNAKMRLIMPTMSAPFGAGTQKKNESKYSMAISFEGMDADTAAGRKLRRAYDKMQQIDDRVRDLMMEHKETLYKDVKDAAGTKKDPKKKGSGPISDELVQLRYESFIKPGKDMPDLMYLSLQTARVPEKDAAKYTEQEKAEMEKRFAGMPGYDFLVDNDGNAIDITTENVTNIIPWQSRVKPVIELAYCWVMKDKFYPIWSFVHGLLASNVKERSFDIRREDDDEDEDAPREEEDAMQEDEAQDGDEEDAMQEDDEPREEEAEA